MSFSFFTLKSVRDGVKYLFSYKKVLGAISYKDYFKEL
jgi:hypothetical protein